MSLSKIFEELKHQLHYGPAMEPFHRASIAAIEELKEANHFLHEKLKAMEQKFEDMFPPYKGNPWAASGVLQQQAFDNSIANSGQQTSILMEGEVEAPAVAAAQTQAAAVQAVTSAVPDDGASLISSADRVDGVMDNDHSDHIVMDVININAAAPESTEMSSPPSAPADPVPAAPEQPSDAAVDQQPSDTSNPAEPGITPSPVSSAQPEPVSAGLDQAAPSDAAAAADADMEAPAPAVADAPPAASDAAPAADTNQGA